MKQKGKITHKLLYQFFAGYLLAILLPTFILGAVLYSSRSNQVRAELLAEKRALLLANKANLDVQLVHVEEVFRALNSSAALAKFLERENKYDNEIIYAYTKEILPLFTSVNTYNSAVKALHLYTSNERVSKLLPEFSPMDALPHTVRMSDGSLRANADFIKGKWVITARDGAVELAYYCAILNASYTEIVGIVELQCLPSIFGPGLNRVNAAHASYLYQDGRCLLSVASTPQAERLLAESSAVLTQGNATEVRAFPAQGLFSEKTHYDRLAVDVVGFSPMQINGVWDNSQLYFTWLPILGFFIVINLIFLPTIFRPLRNISQLANHMWNTSSYKLTPYVGEITRDEVGDLIKAYNLMVSETNRLGHEVRRNETLRKNAQIEALQAQLNPHFFYGTLENIRMIAEMHHETLIAEIAVAFGNLMRYSLARTYFVPICAEVDVVRQYLDIQEKRFGGRFAVNWNIALEDESYQCPKFVLYTLVENVFVHSISCTRKTVLIDIAIVQQGGDVLITVQNTGPGIDAQRVEQITQALREPEKRKQLKSTSNGQGIFNIHDRLQLYYGSDYQLMLESDEEQGTKCCVRLRRMTQQEQERFKEGREG